MSRRPSCKQRRHSYSLVRNGSTMLSSSIETWGKRIDHLVHVLPLMASNPVHQRGIVKRYWRKTLAEGAVVGNVFLSVARTSAAQFKSVSWHRETSETLALLSVAVETLMRARRRFMATLNGWLPNRSRRTNRDWRFEQIVFLVSSFWQSILQRDVSDSLFCHIELNLQLNLLLLEFFFCFFFSLE